jgi:hypothetical protein
MWMVNSSPANDRSFLLLINRLFNCGANMSDYDAEFDFLCFLAS